MNDILFVVEEADDSLEELHREIRDAVHCHLEEGEAPPLIRLNHVCQELLAL